MYRSAAVFRVVASRSIDPTDHGSNLGVVAALAVGILVFIGVLVILITRRGRGSRGAPPERLTAPRPATGAGVQADAEAGATTGSEPDGAGG